MRVPLYDRQPDEDHLKTVWDRYYGGDTRLDTWEAGDIVKLIKAFSVYDARMRVRYGSALISSVELARRGIHVEPPSER